uniref:Uncharacterized protein n=1 Tax=Arcella intermedia TaxID=1963864 RepID=A0A6B2LCA4_9EUKA
MVAGEGVGWGVGGWEEGWEAVWEGEDCRAGGWAGVWEAVGEGDISWEEVGLVWGALSGFGVSDWSDADSGVLSGWTGGRGEEGVGCAWGSLASPFVFVWVCFC